MPTSTPDPFAAWVVVSPAGRVRRNTVAPTRERAIDAIAPEGTDQQRTRVWRDLYRQGWRCVPCTVAPRPRQIRTRGSR